MHRELHHCTLLIKLISLSQVLFEKGDSNLRVDLSSVVRRRRAKRESTATAPQAPFLPPFRSSFRASSPRDLRIIIFISVLNTTLEYLKSIQLFLQ